MGCYSISKTNEFDEPRTLEDVVRKLKHCYEQSRCKPKLKTNRNAKGSSITRGKRHGNSRHRPRKKVSSFTTNGGKTHQNFRVAYEGCLSQANEGDGSQKKPIV